MTIRVCLAGATGWAGGALARAIAREKDLALVAGVARRSAGRRLGEVLGVPGLEVVLSATADEALGTPCDVFVEYTKPDAARANAAAALKRGVHTIIGTSGLSDEDLDALGALAAEHQVGVLAVGNFSVAAVVLQKCAALAARYLPQWEIVDYASATKPDAPSGTARELVHRLAKVRAPQAPVPVDQIRGPQGVRGATMHGTQVHSVRLPGHVLSIEAVFGTLDEKLSLRYDAGSSAEPYVEGALLAIRNMGGFTGLRRGLDSVMEM